MTEPMTDRIGHMFDDDEDGYLRCVNCGTLHAYANGPCNGAPVPTKAENEQIFHDLPAARARIRRQNRATRAAHFATFVGHRVSLHMNTGRSFVGTLNAMLDDGTDTVALYLVELRNYPPEATGIVNIDSISVAIRYEPR